MKAKKFTRYDPYTGRKVSVTADDPRYTEYLERKPSAQARKANKLLDKPLETIREEVTKDVSRKVATRVQAQVRRTSSGIAKGIGAAVTASPISRVLPALGAVGALAAAGILGGWLMDRAGAAGRLPTMGDRVNELSRNFVEAQRALMHKTGASSWGQVPQGPREKLLAEYKAAIVELTRAGDRARYSPVRKF